MSEPQPLGGDRLELGEGARWVDGRLVLVDILAGRLLAFEPARPGSLEQIASVSQPLGAVAPLAGHTNRWIAAVGPGIAVLDPPDRLTWIARPEAGRPGAMRMNDGVADPHGRFFAGSMDQNGTPDAGRLYRLDPAGSISVAVEGITIPNGPAFDPSGRVAYLADTAKAVIWRYRVDPRSGEFGGRHELVRFGAAAGAPDGMTVDDRGRLWVALWGSGKIACLHPDGTLDHEIELPARQPTSVCLTPASPGVLWVTSAAYDLKPPGTADGAVFRLPVDTTAPAASRVRLERGALTRARSITAMGGEESRR